MDKAMATVDLHNLYLDTLLAAAQNASGAWLEGEIMRAYHQIRESAYQDPAKPFSDEQFEQDVQVMLEFARLRGPFVIADVLRSR
jgi:hypothetical protein